MNYAKWLILPWAWVLWWVFQAAVKLPTMILGLLVVPALYKYRYTDLQNMPAWSKPWVNPEDWTGGVLGNKDALPDWWIKENGNGFWSFYKYHAIRNPADGLRNFPKWNLQISPRMVEYWTPEFHNHYEPWFIKKPGVYGYIAWQGIWCGAKLQWIRENTYTEIKIGFRVEPRDKHFPLPPNSARRILGASFASKFIPAREW